MSGRPKEDSIREFITLHRATVPYIGQSYSWDCGIACTEMALRARGVKKVSVQDLLNTCSTSSVWSVDIAYLFRKYRMRATFYTLMKGVRPEYRKQEFYKRQLSEDTKRVTRLFSNAEREGVRVVQRSISLAEIRTAILEKNKLVLVLMDKGLLKCSTCSRSFLSSRRVYSPRASLGFVGHYVLLYAYHAATDKFLMKDPASMRDTCVISSDTLEEARKAFGTDQDILFIGDADKNNDALRSLTS